MSDSQSWPPSTSGHAASWSEAKKEAKRVQEAAVASRLRTGGSLAFASGLVGLGFTMVIVNDLAWPIFRKFLDKLWGPITGGVLVLTGSILITTTIITRMTAKGKPTTHLAAPDQYL